MKNKFFSFHINFPLGQASTGEVAVTDFTPTMAEPPNQTHRPQQPLHQIDADEDDDNVKQLKQCSSLYLSLQVLYPTIYI